VKRTRIGYSMVVVGFMLLRASDLRAADAAPCAALLTTAEVQTALGTTVETVEPVQYSPGFTLCSWTKDRPEGGLGVHFSLFELQAIREGMVSAESIPEYFDLQVSSKQEEVGAEPAKLEGIGKRAVLFSEEYLWIVMIELEDGFAHLGLSATDITRAQVETMAKAVDSRAKE
jgi:hypothetical protein